MTEELQKIIQDAKDLREEAEKVRELFLRIIPEGRKLQEASPVLDRMHYLADELGDPLRHAQAWNIEAQVKLDFGPCDNSIIDAIERSFDIFQTLGYQEGILSSYNNRARYYKALDDQKAAIRAYEKILELLPAGSKERMALLANHGIGLCHTELGDLTAALHHMTIAMKMAEEAGDKVVMISTYVNMASIASRTGIYTEAMQYYIKAQNIADTIGNHRSGAHICGGIAILMLQQGNKTEGLKYLNLALDHHGRGKITEGISHTYSEIGGIYLDEGDHEKAEINLQEALRIAELSTSLRSKGIAYCGLGKLAYVRKEYEKALAMYQNALAAYRKIESKHLIAIALIGIVPVYNQYHRYAQSIEALTEAHDIALKMNSNSLLKDVSLGFSEAYEAMGNYEKALPHHKEYHRISAIELGEETRRQLNNLNFQHNLEQIEKNLELEKNARKVEEEKNSLLYAQKDLIEKSLKEREMLLKEIHHRVKNNLQIISSLLELQSEDIDDEKAKAAISEGQNRVRSIALIHSKLYQNEDIATIEFKSFVNDLYAQIAAVFKRDGQVVEVFWDMEETCLDIDTVVPLGLILNELITNAFKYAFDRDGRGYLAVTLDPVQEGEYTLRVRDNGSGLPADLDLDNAPSLGLKLINNLSTQIGGSSSYHYEDGSVFTIEFKDTQTRKLSD